MNASLYGAILWEGHASEKYYNRSGMLLAYVVPPYTILLVLGIVGNIVVCLTISCSRKLWKPCYGLVMNLAISDMGFAIASISQLLMYFGLQLGEYGCKMAIYTTDICLGCATLSLAYISMDRYYSICCAHERRVVNGWIIVLGAWLGSGFVYFPFLFTCGSSGDPNSILCDCHSRWPSARFYAGYAFVIFFMTYLAPVLAMVFSYTRIYGYIRMRVPILEECPPIVSSRKRSAARMMFVATIVFVISWTPFNVLYMLKKFDAIPEHVFSKIWLPANVLGFANSSYNPYIYAILNQNFREGFRALCCRRPRIVSERTSDLSRRSGTLTRGERPADNKEANSSETSQLIPRLNSHLANV